jgi:hypothetical protein
MAGRAFSAPGFTDMRRHSGKNESPASLEAQATSTIQSVQTPNVNSSSLRDIFKVVAKVASVSHGYRSRGPGSILGYQIFWEVVGLERGPLGLVRIIEELFQSSVI